MISLPKTARKPVSSADVKIHQVKYTGVRRTQASGVAKLTGWKPIVRKLAEFVLEIDSRHVVVNKLTETAGALCCFYSNHCTMRTSLKVSGKNLQNLKNTYKNVFYDSKSYQVIISDLFVSKVWFLLVWD